jgi:hypothetical protein
MTVRRYYGCLAVVLIIIYTCVLCVCRYYDGKSHGVGIWIVPYLAFWALVCVPLILLLVRRLLPPPYGNHER